MRARAAVLLSLVLASTPIVAALPGPAPAPATDGEDRPPIRIHGDEQFLLPTSGVVNPGAEGDADDPYVISGWTVRPVSARGLQADIDAFGKKCKPTPPVSPSPWAPLLLHGIEIVDTTKHVRIENVTVLPREPEDLEDPGGGVDSAYMIGILLRNADHVTIRNVTIGEPTGERLYRGICAKHSDDLTIRESTVQHTKNDRIEVTKGSSVTVVNNVLTDGRTGIEAVQVNSLRISDNAVIDGSGGVRIEDGSSAVVDGNTIEDNGGIGVHLKGAPSDVSVVDNVIADHWNDGIRIDGGSNVVITGNNIAGNGDTGLQTDLSVDAMDNWWGDDSGPSGGIEDCKTGETADGQGDPIRIDDGATVCFDPWLSSPNSDAGA